MWIELAPSQSAVARAILETIPAPEGWTVFFAHAEFSDDERIPPAVEAFVLRPSAEPAPRQAITLDQPVRRALSDLHAAYRQAGDGFHRVDVTVFAPDGRYQFEFDRRPSLVCAGQPDPAWESHLAARYVALLPPPPVAPRAVPAAARGPLNLHPTTRANLERTAAIAARSAATYAAYAGPADAERRPNLARLFRALATAEARQAALRHRLLGLQPPTGVPEAIGTTRANLAAAHAAERAEAEELYPAMLDAAAVEPNGKLRDLFFFARAAADSGAFWLQVALDRDADGLDLGDADPLYVCGLCGAIEAANAMPCMTCESAEFVEVR